MYCEMGRNDSPGGLRKVVKHLRMACALVETTVKHTNFYANC
jgi:hypothetical protein